MLPQPVSIGDIFYECTIFSCLITPIHNIIFFYIYLLYHVIYHVHNWIISHKYMEHYIENTE